MNSITTLKANCTDCHRCVRSCPVKAIGIYKGQARLVDDNCILCGRCVIECPQKAKQVQNELDLIRERINSGVKVALSLAPSFVSSFADYQPDSLLQALHGLGFSIIEETAIGAEIVSGHYSYMIENENKPVISACCPVVVNLIERYYPALIDNVAQVVSPMIAHGRLLKERLGNDVYVVFAGPCIAKISEAADEAQTIDAVITFEQLRQWLEQPGSHKEYHRAETCCQPYGPGRYYPITGGILKSFMNHDETDTDIITVDGIDNCMETFAALLAGAISPRFIEMLACSGGCIGGPVNGSPAARVAKRMQVIKYAQKFCKNKQSYPSGNSSFSRCHEANPIALPLPSNEQIRRILQQIGKHSAGDEKNCGACGYNSCREKAIAVYQGLAETEMCLPYMRSKAESFSNIIVTHSLNAIIVIDRNMIVQDFNPAAAAMFNGDQEITKGNSLTRIIDCSQFLQTAQTGEKVIAKRVAYPQYNLVTEQMIVPVPNHDVVIAIITNVTDEEQRLRELQQMKLETIQKATQVIDKQMQVAQEIAGLLGETTAETKSALLEVIWLLRGKGGA